jgi:hypothetical protein
VGGREGEGGEGGGGVKQFRKITDIMTVRQIRIPKSIGSPVIPGGSNVTCFKPNGNPGRCNNDMRK